MSAVVHVEQARTLGLIGASDAAAILSLDKYRSPLSVALELRGEVPAARPAFVREAADWGQLLEPVIRGKYAIDTQTHVVVPEASVVLGHGTEDREPLATDWLRCTPDGYVYTTGRKGVVTSEGDSGRDDEPAGLLQVKTCSAYLRDAWRGPDGAPCVPPAYEVQCRTELAVTGLPWCDVVCLVGGQTYVGPIRIHRDLEIEARIVADLRAFWDRCIVRCEDPDVDDSQAWRERASGGMRSTAIELAADETTEQILATWKEARKITASGKEQEEICKTRLLLRLGEAGAARITSSYGPVTTYKTGARTAWKDYAIDLGGAKQAPEKYKTPGKSWVLKAPPGFGDEEGDE